MTALYACRDIRELERLASEEAGITAEQLMERAGQALLNHLSAMWSNVQSLCIVSGKGNNAGDGFVLARLACQKGLTVKILTIVDPSLFSPLAFKNYQLATQSGVQTETWQGQLPAQVDLYVDALFGIGYDGTLEEPYLSVIEQLNQQQQPVLAVDIPSSLHADTGGSDNIFVHADLTVTFLGIKQGMVTRNGPEACGKIVCDTLEVPSTILAQVATTISWMDWERIEQWLPRRARSAHKGDYGHVLVIGGDYGMGGAVRMAAEAAMRVGAGLVTVATRPEHVSVVSGSRPEIMCHQINDPKELIPLLERATVIAIGPGLGKTVWAEGLLNIVLKAPQPKLLDADALNVLSEAPCCHDDWILTPHPGEAARLLNCAKTDVQEDRYQTIRDLQAQYGGVIVLKGSGTLVKGVDPNIEVCPAGNPGMASGGMGDVLTGIIAGLLAQGLSLNEAAIAGVLVHARAADQAAEEGGERGLLATDVLQQLRSVVNPAS